MRCALNLFLILITLKNVDFLLFMIIVTFVFVFFSSSSSYSLILLQPEFKIGKYYSKGK